MAPKKKATATNNTNKATVSVVIHNDAAPEPKKKSSERKPARKGTNVGRTLGGIRGGRNGMLLPPYNSYGTTHPPPAVAPHPAVVINTGQPSNTVAPANPYGGGGGSTMDWTPQGTFVASPMNTANMSDASSYFHARASNRSRTMDNMRAEFDASMADAEAVQQAVNEATGNIIDERDVNIDRAREWMRGEFNRQFDNPAYEPGPSPLDAARNAPISDGGFSESGSVAAPPPPQQPQQPTMELAPFQPRRPTPDDVRSIEGLYADYLDHTSTREKARLKKRILQMARGAGVDPSGSLQNVVGRYAAVAAGAM